ncbi:MAG TPA: ABC transporter substrate-binding protein [Gaiellaceae bacterium]|nr:ABC transporter substrate-binding protein [Gaiellaceae bacterium]
MRRALALLLLVSLLGLVAASCGGDDDEPDTAAPVTEAADTGAATEEEEAPDACAPESLELVNEGRLTIGTDNPAFPPWFEGGSETDDWELNDPATGEGYESAVAYLVAEELGFAEGDVDWTAVPFNQIFRPGPKSFDFAINQVSYTPERDEAVDFSASYYDVNQAVVTVEGSDIEGATTVAELGDARLGAPVGTTSYQTIVDVVQPSQEPRVYDDLNATVSALGAGQVDGIVVDLPTAFFVTAVQIDGGSIVGQFRGGDEQEYFGLVVEDGNPLRDCLDEALAALRESGALEAAQQEWLADKASAPFLD